MSNIDKLNINILKKFKFLKENNCLKNFSFFIFNYFKR